MRSSSKVDLSPSSVMDMSFWYFKTSTKLLNLLQVSYKYSFYLQLRNSMLCNPVSSVVLLIVNNFIHMSMVSFQKGPTRHAYAWQIGPFWQDTIDVSWSCRIFSYRTYHCAVHIVSSMSHPLPSLAEPKTGWSCRWKHVKLIPTGLAALLMSQH